MESVYVTMLITVSLLVDQQETSVFLQDTEDGSLVEFYDCLYHDGLNYCRRPTYPQRLFRHYESWHCSEKADRFTFSELLAKNISVQTILHTWKSSLEMVELYARYRAQSDDWRKRNDRYLLCRCNANRFFGKFCEYQFMHGNSMAESIAHQNLMRSIPAEMNHITADLICYETLICDSGRLCLDWRDICDGIQQCMFGIDEDNCDLLEYNECNIDEYRCMNGMCIPDEYFLDGDYDCMDLTDEIGLFNETACPFTEANIECDDRPCFPNEWSCGDGQCIKNRLTFQRWLSPWIECANRRDQWFMCETHASDQQWTADDGHCLTSMESTEQTDINRTQLEDCIFFFQCAFSQSFHSHCPCQGNKTCLTFIPNPCPFDMIPFPMGPVLAPYAQILSRNPRPWSDFVPDQLAINGTIRCRGHRIQQLVNLTYLSDWNYRSLEFRLCSLRNNNTQILSNSDDDYLCYPNRSSSSIEMCKKSHECISQYRMNDGYYNCADKSDENSTRLNVSLCSNVNNHRFRCSAQESTCFFVHFLGDLTTDCKNKFDESWMGTGIAIFKMNCHSKAKDDCQLIRQYVKNSWQIDYDSIEQINNSQSIPFRAYCDTFWDLNSKQDENTTLCLQYWQCLSNQWKCRSGQCISKEWLLDGEWDCADGSDEEAFLFKEDSLTQMKENGMDSDKAILKFLSRYYYGPLSTICNTFIEFRCFQVNGSNAWSNLTNNRPCIGLEKLGDHVIDCLGGLDEQNTIELCEQPTMLGKRFKCLSTDTCMTYTYICDIRCPNRSDDDGICSAQRRSDTHNQIGQDYTCFDGKYIESGWCNDEEQCQHGEDEYLCDEYGSFFLKPVESFYRRAKELSIKYKEQPFPFETLNEETKKFSKNQNKYAGTALNVDPLHMFTTCNRGLNVAFDNGTIVCFCPQFYYGDKCQYHQDRLTFRFHLNYSQSRFASLNDSSIVLKLVILFLYEEDIISSSISHVRPALEINTYSKKTVHLIYSRMNHFLIQKHQRFRNRTDILQRRPYSIRVEAYYLNMSKKPNLTSVWEYPVDFDYLPSYRMIKILHLIDLDIQHNPCSSNPCNQNQECQPILNKNGSYRCLCLANFSGENCSQVNDQCLDGICAPQSLCKPGYRGLLYQNDDPYCICPSIRFGSHCYLEYDKCHSNPCKNQGSCFPTSNPDRYFCHCSPLYHGKHCEIERAKINIDIEDSFEHDAAVIQYLTINFDTLDLILSHQQVFYVIPHHLFYEHTDRHVPEIILARIYSNRKMFIHLISIRFKASIISRTVPMDDTTRCHPIETLLLQNHRVLSPIQYHSVCIHNENISCFYDHVYLCICDENHTRVDCFQYEQNLDRCSACLASGICLKGNPRRSDDQLCICPACFHGRLCQFSTQQMSFTLDSLLVSYSFPVQLTYLILVTMITLIGGLMNYASFLTFVRPEPRRIGVGNYLLIFSIFSQLSLIALLIKISHIVLFNSVGDFACRLNSYLSSVSTRITYWLTSWISIERVCMVLYPFSNLFKGTRLAMSLSFLTMIVLASMHVHELLHYISLQDSSGETVCTIKADELLSNYNRITIIVHYIGPFVIQILSTTLLIFRIARNRSMLSNNHSSFSRQLKQQFDSQRELYLAPMIIILSSLPHIILSFCFACLKLQNWQRHIMLAAYLLSHAPQVLGFLLFVLSSSTYRKQYQQTTLSKWSISRYFFRQ